MTIQPGAVLYTQSFGSRPEGVEVPVYQTRSPSSSDINYPIGKRWIDTVGASSWELLQLVNSAGTLTANWQLASGSGSGIQILTGDSGSATGSSVLITGGSTGLTTSGSGATMTIGGTLALANGGTSASLTASNGGIFYSTATAGAILSGTATAGQIIRSGASAAPSWSTATYPATSGTSGNVLTSDGTNWVSAAPATSSVTWTSTAITVTATVNQGIFATAALTINLPASPSEGNAVYVATTTGSNVVIDAPGSQVIQIGTGASSAGGTATSSAIGNSIYLVYKSSNTTWYSVSAPQGSWVLA